MVDRMVVRCLPLFLYICISSFCICIVCIVVMMSFSGLHSIVIIWVCGVVKAVVINLVSLGCIGVKCMSRMFL